MQPGNAHSPGEERAFRSCISTDRNEGRRTLPPSAYSHIDPEQGPHGMRELFFPDKKNTA